MGSKAGPRLPHGGRRLLRWTGDPRGFQLGFTALYLLDLGIRMVVGARLTWWSWPAASLALVLLLLAVTPLVRPRHLALAALVLPVLDLLAVGLSRLASAGGSGLLIVMPTLWLGRIAGRRGALIAVVSTVLLVSVPAVLYAGSDPELVARAVIYPIVVAAAGMAMAESMEWLGLERIEVERQRDQLAEALDTIAHQRRVSEAVFDTVDVGLVLLDGDGHYVGINRRQQDFLDLAFPHGHKGWAGQLGEVYDVDGRTPLTGEETPSHRAYRGEEFDDVRMWIGHDPATRRAVSVTARVVRSQDGELAGAALGYTDVTEMMRALQVKDEFVALVSHELRTPLTSIVGYAQLLEDEPGLSARALGHLDVMQRNAERLHRLIADLLDTAQRDRGAPMALNQTEVDLVRIVHEAVEAVRTTARGGGVALALDTPDRLMAQVDSQRIAQVVDNLLSNAVKYTETDGEVQVCLRGVEDRAELEVTDTGIGIAPDDVERLFNRFFRSREAERRAVPGAGLGLAISRDIVESHGGQIEVRSDLGQGSTFRVHLPRYGASRPAS